MRPKQAGSPAIGLFPVHRLFREPDAVAARPSAPARGPRSQGVSTVTPASARASARSGEGGASVIR